MSEQSEIAAMKLVKAIPSRQEVEFAEADVRSLYGCGCFKTEFCGCGTSRGWLHLEYERKDFQSFCPKRLVSFVYRPCPVPAWSREVYCVFGQS